jgi:hypothetical protein
VQHPWLGVWHAFCNRGRRMEKLLKISKGVKQSKENTFSPPPPSVKGVWGKHYAVGFPPLASCSVNPKRVELRKGRSGKPLRHSGFPEPFPHSLVRGGGEKWLLVTHTTPFPSACEREILPLSKKRARLYHSPHYS